jgi:hypothetical protein
MFDLFSDCCVCLFVCDNVKKNHKLECFFVLFFIIMLLFLTHPVYYDVMYAMLV